MPSEFELNSKPDLQGSLAALGTLFQRLRGWVDDNSEPIMRLVRLAHSHVIFDKAGWIPHYTTPFDLIGDEITEAELSQTLNNYYSQNWQQISAEFKIRLDVLDVDGEAKATFEEALNAHGAGFYRATVRLLFPEIERVARAELLEGTLKGIASLEDVRKAAGERLGFSELEPTGGGPVLAQFGRMSRHLYEDVKTLDKVASFSLDPVPNRHAALHGLVVYSTLQCSLNTLMMTEFMFQVVTALKASRAENIEKLSDQTHP